MCITDWSPPDGALCAAFNAEAFPVPVRDADFYYCTDVANNLGSPYQLWEAVVEILKDEHTNFIEAFNARAACLQTLFRSVDSKPPFENPQHFPSFVWLLLDIRAGIFLSHPTAWK